MVAEQIETMRIQPAQVALADRQALAVEEFEDLDGDLAAVVQTVAQIRGVYAQLLEYLVAK